jgi:hypothetical protein
MVLRHEYQANDKSGQLFIYITENAVSAVPKLPIYGNSSAWEKNFFPLKRRERIGNRGYDGQNFRDGHASSSSTGSSISTSSRFLEKKVL